MKIILIIGLGFFAFACSDANTTNEEADTETTTTEETLGDGDVEIGSGEEISPQLEGLEDTGRLEVDTISSPIETNQ
ncbi:hypothetical protein [Pontibacter populi]|uniref:Uncharacterized protein n=1 Tax=Pontibacter populi TaxID=890055 RepID=A0ABV1RQU4_9BACT